MHNVCSYAALSLVAGALLASTVGVESWTSHEAVSIPAGCSGGSKVHLWTGPL